MLPLRIGLLVVEMVIEITAYFIVWIFRDAVSAELQVGLTLLIIAALLIIFMFCMW